jgi:pyruvate/2-oxoglutarate dehydrogenase complex dihydrolipoamide acyltransferase (E2) component
VLFVAHKTACERENTRKMATSADKLAIIISALSKEFNFDNDKAIEFLATQGVLPKKLLPNNNVYASKKAEEFATTHNIIPSGKGTGKYDAWTIADLKKLVVKPVKFKLLISPNALTLANEKGVTIAGRTGTGKDGRIILKDVHGWIEAEPGTDDSGSDNSVSESEDEEN